MEQIKFYFVEILGWLGKAALVAMAIAFVKGFTLLMNTLEANDLSGLWAFPIALFVGGVIWETVGLSERIWNSRPSAVARCKGFVALAEMDLNRVSDMSDNDAGGAQ